MCIRDRGEATEGEPPAEDNQDDKDPANGRNRRRGKRMESGSIDTISGSLGISSVSGKSSKEALFALNPDREMESNLRFKIVKNAGEVAKDQLQETERTRSKMVKQEEIETQKDKPAGNYFQYWAENMKTNLPPNVQEQLMKKSQEYSELIKKNAVSMQHEWPDLMFSSPFAGNSMMGAGSKKIGGLTVEERKIKVEKYLQKRKHRSWNKKISYDCRKRVAESRLRIKGRFVTKEQAVGVLGMPLEEINLLSVGELKALLKSKFDELPTVRKRDRRRNERKQANTESNTTSKNMESGSNGTIKRDQTS
eukprot:TRINITY_DN9365_c0_g1_i2.p1 TRINITY_DN9365_c0_g1~~TRINITY_DN9365_c0_g1_i2.p1  ORF type:complete len:308 (+),score=73.62 TRINITY_DN9365_c0_g1_i2:64-987(+)